MKAITPIRTETDFEAARAEVEALWGAEPGSENGDRLEVLMVLVADYEAEHHPVDLPDPVEAVRIRMEEKGMNREDLAALLGVDGERASEILGRRRRLTVGMVRKLAPALGLSERCLVQDTGCSGRKRRRASLWRPERASR
jgi:HTH-type transcriptional regulator/antitoxin HigA